MVTWFYLMVFVLSLVLLIRVLFTNKKVDTMLMLAVILVMLNCLGRYLVAATESLEVALLANKMLYAGACYVSPVLVLILAKLCGFKMPNILKAAMFLYSSIIMAAVLTIGNSRLYYKSVELVSGNGYNYLVKTYGPMHVLYSIFTFIYASAMVFFIIYAVKERHRISLRTVATMGGIGAAVFCIYILQRITGSNISFLALGYLVGVALLIRYFETVDMYDMSANIYHSIDLLDEYGYIAVDNKYRYANANHLVKELFPEMDAWVVDKEIPVSDSYLYREIICYLLEWDGKEKEPKIVSVNENFYQISVRYITHGKKGNVGYLLEFVDRTLEKKYYNTVEEYNVSMEREVAEKTEEILEQQRKTKELFVQTVTALSDAVDAKDRYTSGHSKRVAEYARMIAARMGKDKEEQDEIYRAGLLHDVGKIRVPAEIINKAGKLTDEEFNIIKLHPVTGYHILSGISGNEYIAAAAKYHHERFDGKGYPNGLSGENIPEVARILSVADAYDAMASNRSYRAALPQEVVRSEIEKGKGTQFDPYVADIMLQMMEEDKEYSMKQAESMQRRILSVDDEVMNNKMVELIMRDEPMYEIVSVESGREAIAILEQQHFDLVLLDLRMPEMDGLETLRLIRRKHRMPVVIMTGDKTLDASAEFAKLGCNDYITKPVLPIVLKEVIYNMTERASVVD